MWKSKNGIVTVRSFWALGFLALGMILIYQAVGGWPTFGVLLMLHGNNLGGPYGPQAR